ncbi:MAG: hypothetical protein OEV08_13015, partial [Nitrospira sp.]|nr:hypothetical protein [Nitrospira sp.]
NGSMIYYTQEGTTNWTVQGNYGPDLIWGDGLFTTAYAQNQQLFGGDGGMRAPFTLFHTIVKTKTPPMRAVVGLSM